MIAELIDLYFIKQPRFRRVVTRLLYGSSAVPVSLLGAQLLIHSGLENGYLRAFRHARTLSLFRDEAAVLINLANLIGDNCTFLDIGANIGIFSAVIARLSHIKRGLRIFAFEVDPNTFERLRQNASRYGFHAECIGLAELDEIKEFVRGAVSHVTTPLASINSYSIRKETFTARCVPLSSFDIPGSSLVMKIDVEGGEYEVLAGAEKFFAEDRVRAVYLHDISRLQAVQEFLEKYRFKLVDGVTLTRFEPGSFSLLAIKDQ